MLKSRSNNLIKGLSKKVLAGLIFGIAVIAGITLVLAFTEPISGPSGFDEPENFQDRGDWFAYGRGWQPNASGDGSTALTKTACDNADNWYWFEDGNGDGDTVDEEDGICVFATTTIAKSWNGDDDSVDYDNTYIASYECEGNFPNGYVTSTNYRGVNDASPLAFDNTWNNGDCALCQADCYDGKKDLPDNPYATTSHYIPSYAEAGHNGPITPEVLKNWTGTKLPTSNDFFGFCGAADGDANNTAGDSNYYSSGASASTTLGKYGGNVGRGNSSEYMYLSNSVSYEWLAEQRFSFNARVAGVSACSYFGSNIVNVDNRFRAVFRP